MDLSQPHYIERRENGAHLSLDGMWDLGYAPEITAPGDVKYTMRAKVPGTVFWQLYEAGVMPNPYEGVNSKAFGWTDDQVWYYRRRFTLEEAPRGKAYLCFDGACYYTRVWLNGHCLGEHEGMFGGPVAEAGGLLAAGENELVAEVRACNWHEPRFTSRNEDKSIPHPIVPWNLMREKGALTGDFNVIGLWGGVRIEFLDPVHLSRPYMFTESVTQDAARLHFEVEISDPDVDELGAALSDSSKDSPEFTFSFFSGNTGARRDVTYQVLIEMTEHGTGQKVYAAEEDYTPYDWRKSLTNPKYYECHHYRREIELPDPKIWMPAALGTPELYDVRVALTRDGKLLDELRFRTGIRVIRREYTAGDKFRARWDRFAFVINGRHVFLTGVNWMPIDHFLILRREEYRWSLERARDMGVMMIRVWSGGGIPETDTFYDLCDELGLMVWQDHMIANQDTPNWDHDVLLDQECMNLYRIRNHPSLTVHCGGNEFNPYSLGNLKSMSVIQGAVEDLDGSREYVRTTPDRGSAHIYMDMEPTWYRAMTRQLPFVAESGIHSFPSMKALRRVVSAEEMARPLTDLFSPEFETGNPELRNHFVEYIPERIPRMLSRASAIVDINGVSLGDLVEATQMASYEFYQVMAEALRENYPVTCGLMPWVYRRPSVAVGIQLMDGIGQPIAPYWALKNAYKPLNVSLMLEHLTLAPGEEIPLNVCVMNGLDQDIAALYVDLDIFGPDLSRLERRSAAANVSAGVPVSRLSMGSLRLPGAFTDRYFFIVLTLRNDKKVLVRKTYWPRCLGRMADKALREEYRARPAPNLTITAGPWLKPQVLSCGGARLEVRLEALSEDACRQTAVLYIGNTGTKPAFPVVVDGTELTCTAEDNCFLLDAGESRLIRVELFRQEGRTEKALTVRAWNCEEQVIPLDRV